MNKKKLSLIVFIIGIIILIAGAVTLILSFVLKPDMRDGEFLVEVGKWVKDDEESVIWEFTEIGKGKLTTNNHVNDYDFIWALEEDTLKIETNWLYTLDNEYTYTIDQGAKTLTLTSGEDTYTFSAYVELDTAGGVDAEVTEDD